MANSRKSKSSDLPERVADALTPVLSAGSSILVGLSGGVDSVVLLHLLTQLSPRHAWRISALHVHHGISPHADAWAAFCASLCDKLSVPLQTERVNIAPLREMGIEAAARHLRHEALLRQSVEFIALAHHQDDQAETLLLQLLRGAGAKGAAAMPLFKGIRGKPALVRPLLDVSRTELLAYATEHGLQWVEDESNADDGYPRNFLRHRVLPMLAQRFPAYRETLARSASHFAESAVLMDALAKQDGQGVYDGTTLAVSGLAALDVVRAKNLLRWFVQQRGALMPDSSRLEEALRQLRTVRADAQLSVEWGNWALRCYRGRAYVCHALAEPEATRCIPWRHEEELKLPGGTLRLVRCVGGGLSLGRMQAQPVSVRLRRGGEMVCPDAARPARSAQYLFQEHGIPPWQRPHWPLVYIGESLAAVAGIAVGSEFLAGKDEPGLQLEWCPL
jgi:tRNA(Ile)-lysidine synthase